MGSSAAIAATAAQMGSSAAIAATAAQIALYLRVKVFRFSGF
jgi:hypothetical protein